MPTSQHWRRAAGNRSAAHRGGRTLPVARQPRRMCCGHSRLYGRLTLPKGCTDPFVVLCWESDPSYVPPLRISSRQFTIGTHYAQTVDFMVCGEPPDIVLPAGVPYDLADTMCRAGIVARAGPYRGLEQRIACARAGQPARLSLPEAAHLRRHTPHATTDRNHDRLRTAGGFRRCRIGIRSPPSALVPCGRV